MLSNKNTKNANFLFIADMLKDLLAQELITEKEYTSPLKSIRRKPTRSAQSWQNLRTSDRRSSIQKPPSCLRKSRN